MSNLYDFLRRCLADATASPPYSVNVTPEDVEWLKKFLDLSKLSGNESAFPLANELGNLYSPGLSIREKFAETAMLGMLSSPYLAIEIDEDFYLKVFCKQAIRIADMMIIELNEKQ